MIVVLWEAVIVYCVFLFIISLCLSLGLGWKKTKVEDDHADTKPHNSQLHVIGVGLRLTSDANFLMFQLISELTWAE